MKKHLILAAVSSFLCGSICSCEFNPFAVGAYPYAERLAYDCPAATLVRQVALLKAQARYPQKLPFEDEESAAYPASHNFYFYSAEDKLLFFLSVAPAVEARKATIALVSVLNLEGQHKGQWKRLNQERTQIRKSGPLLGLMLLSDHRLSASKPVKEQPI